MSMHRVLSFLLLAVALGLTASLATADAPQPAAPAPEAAAPQPPVDAAALEDLVPAPEVELSGGSSCCSFQQQMDAERVCYRKLGPAGTAVFYCTSTGGCGFYCTRI